MKNINYIIAIFAILLISLASAEVSQVNKLYYGIIEDDGSLTTTTDAITNVDAIGFVCQNSDCSQIAGTLWNSSVLNSGSSSQLTITYPTILQNAGYGVFYYKEGYIPYEVKSDRAGSGNAPERNNYLTRARSCEVPINNLTISHYGNKIVVNVTLDASVSSPLQEGGPLNYVPDSIANHYAVDSRIDFRFVGPENVTVTEEVSLPYSATKVVSASINELSAGQYIIQAESSAVDDKCLSSINQLLSTNLLIEDNRTNVTLPTISIISPEAKTYTNGTILVRLGNTSATSVWFNYNGSNISYAGPVSIYFPDGTYTLHAYAANNVTTAHHSVTFKVNTTIINNNQTNNDTAAPNSISNLNLVSRTRDSLVWNWTSPNNSDFSQAIIYINGLNAVNTSSNTYTALGLSANTDYTITVHTKDTSGNVNTTDVSLTSRTLANDGGSNNGGNGGSSKNRGSKAFNDTEPVKSADVIYGKNYEEESVRQPKKENKDYSAIFYILFVVSLILLVIILVLLVLKAR